MSFTDMNKGRPGVWFNFPKVVEEAIEGSDGAVAIVKKDYNASATPDTAYEFTSLSEAREIIGTSKMDDIRRAFKGGASKVVVYTQKAPELPESEYDYTGAQTALSLRFFEAVTFDHPLTADARTSWSGWATSQATEERYLPVFYGVDDDTDTAAGIARAVADKSELVATVINAPVFGDVTWKSWEAANWLAGKFASTPLSQSLTYAEVEGATDVSVRLTNAQIVEALSKGAMVFEYTGRKVRLVRGVTTAATSLKNLAFKQTFTRDIKFYLEEVFIGKVPNGSNQRLSAEGNLKSKFMQPFADREIIDPDWSLKVLPGPQKQQVIVDVVATDLETMEEFYITVSQGGSK
ncbi:phage tail sheath subtilisin-like domain-containing protein [Bacillus badius]|uniref:Phage-like element PBSX protein xkdK n=1 Tax=Bacillus badius TaxID=1455 RepID=A0ABR5AXX8_BACBA|nr:phage tail sheath subtilisin-like domain-containing protein [Bacillus badius]KIL79592.1 Phage-like element PBSX protein xkdK [Bacillus badius]MED4716287.1 phage tail sheath subtilisin-like domain-containing protein [Bacillus badius]